MIDACNATSPTRRLQPLLRRSVSLFCGTDNCLDSQNQVHKSKLEIAHGCSCRSPSAWLAKTNSNCGSLIVSNCHYPLDRDQGDTGTGNAYSTKRKSFVTNADGLPLPARVVGVTNVGPQSRISAAVQPQILEAAARTEQEKVGPLVAQLAAVKQQLYNDDDDSAKQQREIVHQKCLATGVQHHQGLTTSSGCQQDIVSHCASTTALECQPSVPSVEDRLRTDRSFSKVDKQKHSKKGKVIEVTSVCAPSQDSTPQLKCANKMPQNAFFQSQTELERVAHKTESYEVSCYANTTTGQPASSMDSSIRNSSPVHKNQLQSFYLHEFVLTDGPRLNRPGTATEGGIVELKAEETNNFNLWAEERRGEGNVVEDVDEEDVPSDELGSLAEELGTFAKRAGCVHCHCRHQLLVLVLNEQLLHRISLRIRQQGERKWQRQKPKSLESIEAESGDSNTGVGAEWILNASSAPIQLSATLPSGVSVEPIDLTQSSEFPMTVRWCPLLASLSPATKASEIGATQVPPLCDDNLSAHSSARAAQANTSPSIIENPRSLAFKQADNADLSRQLRFEELGLDQLELNDDDEGLDGVDEDFFDSEREDDEGDEEVEVEDEEYADVDAEDDDDDESSNAGSSSDLPELDGGHSKCLNGDLRLGTARQNVTHDCSTSSSGSTPIQSPSISFPYLGPVSTGATRCGPLISESSQSLRQRANYQVASAIDLKQNQLTWSPEADLPSSKTGQLRQLAPAQTGLSSSSIQWRRRLAVSAAGNQRKTLADQDDELELASNADHLQTMNNSSGQAAPQAASFAVHANTGAMSALSQVFGASKRQLATGGNNLDRALTTGGARLKLTSQNKLKNHLQTNRRHSRQDSNLVRGARGSYQKQQLESDCDGNADELDKELFRSKPRRLALDGSSQAAILLSFMTPEAEFWLDKQEFAR